MTDDGFAGVAPRHLGDDYWLLWRFPPGSIDGSVRQVRTWADVDRVAREMGIDPKHVRWDRRAVEEMTEANGPPPH
jgi:hypothetical protein